MAERILTKEEIEVRRVRMEKERLLQCEDVRKAMQTLANYQILHFVIQNQEVYIELRPEWRYEKPM